MDQTEVQAAFKPLEYDLVAVAGLCDPHRNRLLQRLGEEAVKKQLKDQLVALIYLC